MDPHLDILVVDDESVVHKVIGNYLIRSGHQITASYNGQHAIETFEKTNFDLVLLDLILPGINGLDLLEQLRTIKEDIPVVLISAHGDLETAIQALRLGATDFLTKPIKLLELDAVIEKATRVGKLQNERRHLRNTIGGIQASENLRTKNRTYMGPSQTAQNVRKQIQQATDAQIDTVLITGETGTGKEVVARAIHFNAYLEQAPFIAVNCPSLTETLIEAELFGHEKGAFTNAANARPGYFEMANEGSLFLDEIGDLAPTLQASLLRVIETRRVRRIGASNEIPITCKVIAATNVDLQQRMQSGAFRSDLFFRLNLLQIHLPPLRERPEDIIPLARHFLRLCIETHNLHLDGFSPSAEKHLQNYDYPGNVRELRNIVEQSTIYCRSGHIEPYHLNLGRTQEQLTPPPLIPPSTTTPPHKMLDRQTLQQALEATHWNRRKAAQQLGITYSKLRYWIQKHSLT